MIKIDFRALGKKIFEQEYVGKYNPETKLFENKNGGLRNIYKERNLIIIKIDLKDLRSYKENDISAHYKFFNDTNSDRVYTYENIDPQCLKEFDYLN